MLQEQEFQPRTLAVLAQHLRFPEELRHTAYHWDSLLPAHECIQTNAKVRISGKSSRHTQRKSSLLAVQTLPRHGRQTNIIDLGIRTPRPATGNGHFELARQIV